jgi:transposase-like protein
MSNYGKRYTREFKEEAVRLLLTSEKGGEALARELGVSGVALSYWKREALRNGDQPQNAKPKGLRIQYSILAQENLRLKRELETVRVVAAVHSGCPPGPKIKVNKTKKCKYGQKIKPN